MSNKIRILEINQQIEKLQTELFSIVSVPEITVTVSGPKGSGKTTICAIILNALEGRIASEDNIVFETNPKTPATAQFREFNDLINKIVEYNFPLNRKIKIVEDNTQE